MPKVIFHLRRQYEDHELSRPFLEFYRFVADMLSAAGVQTEMRVIAPDIGKTVRHTGDQRFEDGNLHIVDDRHLQMPNVLNGSLAYFYGFWHLDPCGVRAFSSIGAKTFRENMVPYQYARKFYQRLQRRLKDARRSRHSPMKERENFPAGCVSVFLQGDYPRASGATAFTDISMLKDVLQGAGDRPVVVKPHPRSLDLDALETLEELARTDERIIISGANIHDILAASCVSVSVNSAVSMEGFLHRTPAVLYGRSDFHHMAETISGPGQFAAALERAQLRRGGYAQFLTWYFRNNCLEIGAANLEQKVWGIFGQAGFPLERFVRG